MKSMLKIKILQCLITRLLLSVLLVSPSISIQAANVQADTVLVSSAAESVIDQYFTALTNGDIEAIRRLLGPDLLVKRERLLSNPTYSHSLIEHYSGASYSINGQKPLGNDQVMVRVVISNKGSSTHYEFTLQNLAQSGLRIVNEDEVLQ